MRSAVGDGVAIMVDYNQCLTPADAVQRMRVLDGEGLTWVEEPTLAHDYAGHAQVAREAATPIQCGENWWGPLDMQHAIDAARVRLHDARRHEDRRRHRLAACGVARADPGHPAVEPPVARDLRAAAVRDADRALARIRGLVEPDHRRAVGSCRTGWPTSPGRWARASRGTSPPWRGMPSSGKRDEAIAAQSLRQIADRTLGDYDQRAEDFWEGTRGHDVSQNIASLLRAHSRRAAVHDPRLRLRAGARSP